MDAWHTRPSGSRSASWHSYTQLRLKGSTYGRVGSLRGVGSPSRSKPGEDTTNLEIPISRSTKLPDVSEVLTRFSFTNDSVLLHRQRRIICPPFRGLVQRRLKVVWQREGPDPPVQFKELGVPGGLERTAKFDGWGKTRGRISELPSVICVTGEINAASVSGID